MDWLLEVFWLIISPNLFTYVVILTMVGLICWIMTEFMQMPGLATLFAPILVFSGLLGNYFGNSLFLLTMRDRDADVALLSAIGVMCGLLLLVTCCFFLSIYSEFQAKRIEGRNLALARLHDR